MAENPMVSSKAILDALFAAGLIPEHTARVVIDLDITCAARIYIDSVGDKRLLDVLTPKTLGDALAIHVGEQNAPSKG